MLSSDVIEQLLGSRLKLERAKSHIEDLQYALSAFLERNPYTIFEDFQTDEAEKVFRVRVNTCVPPILGAIIGDIIHNLRSALDLMAVDLARANGHSSRTALKETYFPICIDLDKFRTSGKAKIKRLSARAQEIIEGLEPYKGGHTSGLYDLHHLDIADKHDSLVPVGAAYVGREVSFVLGGPEKPFSEMYPDGIERTLGGIFRMPEVVFPLENDSVVATVFKVHDARSHADVKATFGVVFSDLGIVDGQSVILTFHHFYNLVAWIIETLEAECLI